MKGRKTKVIAIYSPSGGGKTTIVSELMRKNPNSKALFFDDRDYDIDSGIMDLCQWYDEGADVNRYNLQLLADDIELLLLGTLDFVFLDYPWGYRHNLISKFLDFSIFVDTPLDIAFARRLLRDFKDETSEAILQDADFYLKKGRLLYVYGEKMARRDADLMVDGSKTLDDIVGKIHNEIKKLQPGLTASSETCNINPCQAGSAPSIQ